MGEYRLTDKGSFGVLVINMFHYDPDEDTSILGFPMLDLATEYARRRTRDSLEECRGFGLSKEEIKKQWYTFGEDCMVLGGEYKGSAEIDYFIEQPATKEERDWESIEEKVRAG